MIWQTSVLVPFNEPVVHCLIAGAFSLEARQGHQFPLLNEKVASVLAGQANLLKLVSHELAL